MIDLIIKIYPSAEIMNRGDNNDRKLNSEFWSCNEVEKSFMSNSS